MSPPAFSPDFYNNVAAIAVVLIFTKVVSHGIRKVRGKPTGVVLHAAVVGGAGVAAGAALIATFFGSHGWCVIILAWAGIVTAAVSLIFDMSSRNVLTADRRRRRVKTRFTGQPTRPPVNIRLRPRGLKTHPCQANRRNRSSHSTP